jgi:ubiquinone/menaquinone biosynthesis C-methylase UbiE
MVRGLDALTSLTLKHVRERWWNDAFGDFLEGALKPKPGKRILDVGCGVGTAEISLARLQVSATPIVGVDTIAERCAKRLASPRHQRPGGVRIGRCGRLPFLDGVFDCTFCVAVLQHACAMCRWRSPSSRVTRPGGRVLAVEPDNAARYW